MTTWLGVDVGGKHKRFDIALVDERRLICLRSRTNRAKVVALARQVDPQLVAIDSPRACAPDGHTTRDCELQLQHSGICNIRWTPDRAHVEANPCYAWIREGLAKLGLDNLPARTNQDQRDAIAAALTAREHTFGQTQAIGAIIVPRSK
jgi:hypothetical protein